MTILFKNALPDCYKVTALSIPPECREVLHKNILKFLSQLMTCSFYFCHKVKTKTPGGNFAHLSYPTRSKTYQVRFQFTAATRIILLKVLYMLFTELPKKQYYTWGLFAHLLEWQYHFRLCVQQHWIVVEYQRHCRVLAGRHFVSGQDVTQSCLNLHQAESHSWNNPAGIQLFV